MIKWSSVDEKCSEPNHYTEQQLSPLQKYDCSIFFISPKAKNEILPLSQVESAWLHSQTYARIPGSDPSRVTHQTLPSFWVAGLIVSAAWTLLLTAVTVITSRARAVTLCTIPAGFAGIAETIGGIAELVVFTVTTTKDRRYSQGTQAEFIMRNKTSWKLSKLNKQG